MSRPLTVPRTARACSPFRARTPATRSLARNSTSSPTSTNWYVNSGCRAIATLAGSVQGVVVQIRIETLRPASSGKRRRRGAVSRGETHVDGGRDVVLVLHLGFRQGGGAARAPVHRALVAVNIAVLHEAADLLDDRPFVDRGHRQVLRAPLAEHTQPAELVALDADVPLGVGPAGGADLRRRHGSLPGPPVLVDLVLNRQPVAVPARNIRGVEPHHGARLHDNVLEDLV